MDDQIDVYNAITKELYPKGSLLNRRPWSANIQKTALESHSNDCKYETFREDNNETGETADKTLLSIKTTMYLSF